MNEKQFFFPFSFFEEIPFIRWSSAIYLHVYGYVITKLKSNANANAFSWHEQKKRVENKQYINNKCTLVLVCKLIKKAMGGKKATTQNRILYAYMCIKCDYIYILGLMRMPESLSFCVFLTIPIFFLSLFAKPYMQ